MLLWWSKGKTICKDNDMHVQRWAYSMLRIWFMNDHKLVSYKTCYICSIVSIDLTKSLLSFLQVHYYHVESHSKLHLVQLVLSIFTCMSIIVKF